MASVVGLAGSASADATVDLIWTGSNGTNPSIVLGGSSISAEPGDQITLSMMLTAGTEGLSSWGISIQFDSALLNELDFVSAMEFGITPAFPCSPFPTCFTATPTLSPLSPGVSGFTESTVAATGFVLTFEAASLTGAVFDSFGSFQIGEVVFDVNTSVATDGANLSAGFFNTGVDAAYDALSQPVTVDFSNQAAVDAFGPEPGTATLLVLGLLGLAAAGRRNR